MTEAPAPFPPYCGAEQLRTWPTIPEIVCICTRNCHPLTEQHVDVERGIAWPEPGHFIRNPFGQPGTSAAGG